MQTYFIRYCSRICKLPHISTGILRRNVATGNNLLHSKYEIGRNNNSYVHRLDKTTLRAAIMGPLIDSLPDRFGDRMAVIDRPQGIRKNYIEFKADIDKLATGLLALNFQRGDRIGIWSPNRYEWMITQLAAVKAGLIMVPLNPVYQARELEYCLKKLRIRAIVAPDSFRIQDYYKILTAVVPEVVDSKPGEIKSKNHPYFEKLILLTDKHYPGAIKFQDVMDAGGSNERTRLDELNNEIQSEDAATVIFTSGTTGNPKAAVHSHFSIINNTLIVCENAGFLDEPHVICCNVPLFHIFGCHGLNCSLLIAGFTSVLPAPGFHVEASLKAIEDEKCTYMYGTPTMYLDFFNSPNYSKTNLSSLKAGCVSGAPCPPKLIKKIIDKMPCPGLVVGYGATETNTICCHHFRNDSVEVRMANDGKILPNTELKIVDSEDKPVPFGALGEICVRGHQVMKGYWEDEEKNKEVFKDRWYHTGDLGTLSEDGYVKVIGRLKDLIIRGGENINPGEIEDFLMSHPKIAEVHVIGVPDSRLGEEVCAWIKIKENETLTENDVKDFCKGQISYFKIPRYVRFVKEYPKTPLGKVKKFVMQDEMAKILKTQVTN